MTQSNLGRLKQVELRSIWVTEAGDFTPWLAQDDNLRLLGETIGIELEQEAQEKALGPFSVATPAQLAEEVPRVLLRLPT